MPRGMKTPSRRATQYRVRAQAAREGRIPPKASRRLREDRTRSRGCGRIERASTRSSARRRQPRAASGPASARPIPRARRPCGAHKIETHGRRTQPGARASPRYAVIRNSATSIDANARGTPPVPWNAARSRVSAGRAGCAGDLQAADDAVERLAPSRDQASALERGASSASAAATRRRQARFATPRSACPRRRRAPRRLLLFGKRVAASCELAAAALRGTAGRELGGGCNGSSGWEVPRPAPATRVRPESVSSAAISQRSCALRSVRSVPSAVPPPMGHITMHPTGSGSTVSK